MVELICRAAHSIVTDITKEMHILLELWGWNTNASTRSIQRDVKEMGRTTYVRWTLIPIRLHIQFYVQIGIYKVQRIRQEPDSRTCNLATERQPKMYSKRCQSFGVFGSRCWNPSRLNHVQEKLDDSWDTLVTEFWKNIDIPSLHVKA